MKYYFVKNMIILRNSKDDYLCGIDTRWLFFLWVIIWHGYVITVPLGFDYQPHIKSNSDLNKPLSTFNYM